MRVDLQKLEQLYGKLFEVDYNGVVAGICDPHGRRFVEPSRFRLGFGGF